MSEVLRERKRKNEFPAQRRPVIVNSEKCRIFVQRGTSFLGEGCCEDAVFCSSVPALLEMMFVCLVGGPWRHAGRRGAEAEGSRGGVCVKDAPADM